MFQKTFSLKLTLSALIISSMAFYFGNEVTAVPFISKEDEIEMGKGADQDITKHYGIYQDKKLQLYVDSIGQKLVSNLSDKQFRKYFFKVVDSADVNAFALPGGYVYVTRGILAMINSEAELAGVLGHEIGHVIMHHGAKNVIRQIGATLLSVGGAVGGAIASPKNASQWLLVSTQMFDQINKGYGRDAELDSDAQGIINAYESGYNPEGMVSFLKSLRRQEIFSGQTYHSFISTHPDTKDRIIKTTLFSSSLIARERIEGSEGLQDKRKVYLNQLKGLPFGGKRQKNERRVGKPQYIDIYEVKPGDTFTSIAKKELEDETMDLDIAVLNGKKLKNTLVPGELLKIIRDGKYVEKKLEIKPEDS